MTYKLTIETEGQKPATITIVRDDEDETCFYLHVTGNKGLGAEVLDMLADMDYETAEAIVGTA